MSRLLRELKAVQHDARCQFGDLANGNEATTDSEAVKYTCDELRAMAPPGTLKCPVCSKVVAQASGMPTHIRSYAAKKGAHKCPYCTPYTGKGQMALDQHNLKWHRDQWEPRPKQTIFPHCSRSIPTAKIKAHLRTHDQNRRYPCTVCKEDAGASQTALKSHMQ